MKKIKNSYFIIVYDKLDRTNKDKTKKRGKYERYSSNR